MTLRLLIPAVALSLLSFVSAAVAQPYFARTQTVAAPEANNDFVTALDVDGEWAAASGARRSSTAGESAVFMFRRINGVWAQQQRLVCPDASGSTCERFGNELALSGTTLAVQGGQTSPQTGAVFIFEWSGSAWTHQTTLTGPNNKLIGFGLALDGNYLVTVGATRNVLNTIDRFTPFVFERSGTTWTPFELVGTDRVPGVAFGSLRNTSISGDTVCIGAALSDNDTNPGAVHMFRRGPSGWAQEGPKLAPLTTNGARVGLSCAVDADTVAFGAAVFTPGQPGSGRAFVYTRSGSTWSLRHTLLPDAGTEGLGKSIALRGDGLVLGAPDSSIPKALFFARAGSTWVERLRDENPIPNANLGHAVATDGSTLIVGGPAATAFARVGVLAIYAPSTTPPVTTGPPGAPTSVQASANGNTLNMTWGAPTSGAAPTNYTLIARTAAGGPVLGTAALGNVTSFSAVAPNGGFVLSLVASNAFGTGPESAGVSVTLPAVPAPPSAPRTLAASVVGSTATLTWAAPASGGAVANYVLAAGLTPGFAVPLGVLPLPAAPLSYAIPGIPPGTYYLRLQAQNAGGTSAASNEVTVTVAAPAAPGAPTLNAPTVSGSTVGLSWTPGGGGAPTSYVLTALTAGGVVLGSVPVTGASLSVPNVPSGSYLLRIVAVNSVGPSPVSNTVTLVVP